jgi:hypothetical protein
MEIVGAGVAIVGVLLWIITLIGGLLPGWIK